MSHTHASLPAQALRATVAALLSMSASAQPVAERPADATARQLLARADHFLPTHLGLARLQLEQATRLAPALAQAWPRRAEFDAAQQREAQLHQRGLAAAQAMDTQTVQETVRELRRLDLHSAAAVDLVIQANTRLADRGGAIQRLALPLPPSSVSNR